MRLGGDGRNGMAELLHLCTTWRKAEQTPKVYMHTDTMPFRDLDIGTMRSAHFMGGHIVFRAAEKVTDRLVPVGSTEAHVSWARDEGFTLHWHGGGKELFHPTVAVHVKVTVAIDDGIRGVDYVITTRPSSPYELSVNGGRVHEDPHMRAIAMCEGIDENSCDTFRKARGKPALYHTIRILCHSHVQRESKSSPLTSLPEAICAGL